MVRFTSTCQFTLLTESEIAQHNFEILGKQVGILRVAIERVVGLPLFYKIKYTYSGGLSWVQLPTWIVITCFVSLCLHVAFVFTTKVTMTTDHR